MREVQAVMRYVRRSLTADCGTSRGCKRFWLLCGLFTSVLSIAMAIPGGLRLWGCAPLVGVTACGVVLSIFLSILCCLYYICLKINSTVQGCCCSVVSFLNIIFLVILILGTVFVAQNIDFINNPDGSRVCSLAKSVLVVTGSSYILLPIFGFFNVFVIRSYLLARTRNTAAANNTV